jgi:uncharacterized protein
MYYSLLIKPASADCNLRCPYCFYLDRAGLYPETEVHRMPDEVLARVVRSYLETEQPVYSFVWQGGEPLLMGGAFFERVTDLQMAYARRGANVSNAVQTNGTLVTDRLARQFRSCRFLTGVSLDGPEALHDAARVDLAGRGSHSSVLEGIACLKRNGADFNLLALVSKHTVEHPVEIYDYLVDGVGASFVQFIECVELDGQGRAAPYCVAPDEWGRFLCAVFDRWYARDTRKVSVRLFDTILAKLVTGRDICCTAGLDCRQYFVVEYTGDVYPCDFHVMPELRLGNVLSTTWDEMARSDTFQAFGERKRLTHAACPTCEYFSLCAGDCPKNRVGHSAGSASKLSYLCAGWKTFYAHTLPRFEELATRIRKEGRHDT